MEIQANWAKINREINNAPWGQAGLVVKKYARLFGCSMDKIYRERRDRFGKRNTVKREKKIDPENKLMQRVFDLKVKGEQLHLAAREVSTEWAIDELKRQGVKGAETLTVSTVNRRLQQLGYREKQPSVRIESAYANQVHMIDFTRSKYFQLFEYDAREDDFMLVVSGKELHYKKGDARLRTWICQYMDDYSRLRKSRAYAETSESAFLGLDHLSWAWSAAEEDPHAMKYLPLEMLRSDNGSFRKAQETQMAMQSMDINLTKQRPLHHGGTAKIENRMKSLWQEFELPLAIRLGDGGRMWMKEYNDLLYEFCVQEQEKAHPVHKKYTKGEWYRKSLADRRITQRTTDVDLVRLACRVERRKVDEHLRVSLNNTYYAVPQYVDGMPTIGNWVYVHENKYGELTGKLIDDMATSSFALEDWQPLEWGEYGSFNQTPKTRREEAFERETPSYDDIIGGDGAEEAIPLTPPSKGENVRYLGPETEKAVPDSVFAEHIEATGRVFRTELDAREYIGIRLEAWGLGYGDVDSYFEGIFDSLPITQQALDEVIQTINDDYDRGDLSITA